MKLDFYINKEKFAYNTDIEKDNKKSVYATGMYGDEYRIEKATNKVYKNKKYIGTAEYYSIH